MMDPVSAGRLVIIAGLALVVIGAVLMVSGKVPLLGRFPFALVFQRDGFTLFVPIAAMIIISVALTIFLNLFLR